MAMMLDEAIRASGARRGFKVFATDIHDGALEAAGAGIFAPDRLKGISEERLKNYFRERPDGKYQISPEIRHRIVFAKHNLLTDTPFTNLDSLNYFALILCLMIGTASLPHILMRYFTTPTVRDARKSVAWSLFFIFLLYFTAPAYAAFAKLEIYQNVIGQAIDDGEPPQGSAP